MKKNKYLTSLAILLSCMGLPSSTDATNPTETTANTEYEVQLRTPGRVIEHNGLTISSRLLDEANRSELVAVLNNAFNTRHMENDGTFYNFRGALSSPAGLKVEHGKLVIFAPQQSADFYVEDHRFYVLGHSLRHEVYIAANYIASLNGNYLSFADFPEKGIPHHLYVDERRFIYFPQLTSQNDFDELRGALNFFQTLADRRGEDVRDTLVLPVRLGLGIYFDRWALVQKSRNEYVYMVSYARKQLYQFYLRDESGQSNWYQPTWTEETRVNKYSDRLSLPEGVILTKVDLSFQQYSPNIDVGGRRLEQIHERLAIGFCNRFSTAGDLLENRRAMESFDLEALFAEPLVRE